MMYKIITTVLFLVIPLTGLFAKTVPTVPITTKNATIVYTIKGNVETAFNTMMDKPIKALGYRLPDPRTRVNDVYKKQYGSTALDMLSFMTIVNDKKIKPLVEIDPRLAGFNPFSLVVYKHKGKDETVITHLTAGVITEILGITDVKVITAYATLMEELDALIVKTFPTAVTTHSTYEGGLVDTMMHNEAPLT
jgi:hypothetical protein